LINDRIGFTVELDPALPESTYIKGCPFAGAVV
jgi:hypothetical protein